MPTKSLYSFLSWLVSLLAITVLTENISSKYSTLPRGILINIAPKVGIFPEAECRGKYCAILLIFHKEGLNINFIT